MSNQNKFKELFDLSLNALENEHQRFLRFDEKANKYFAAVTVIIGFFSLIAQWIYSTFIPPNGIFEILIVVVMCFTFLVLLWTWWQLFEVLKIRNLAVFPINQEMIDFYYNNNLIDIHYNLSKKISKELKIKRDQSNNKSSLLNKAFGSIKLVFFLFIILLFLLVIHRMFFKSDSTLPKAESSIILKIEGGKIMCEENNKKENSAGKNQSHDTTSDKKSNDPLPREIKKVPDFDIITEGVDHSLRQKKDKIND